MDPKPRILFICQHNSGRSQIAAAYLEKFAGEHLDVDSAGLAPADKVNPLVVEVMQEDGIDLTDRKPRDLFALFQAGELYEHVITVCHGGETQCPVFPGITKRWHWPFEDPASVEGDLQTQLEKVRRIRDTIKDWLIKPPPGAFDYHALIQKT